MKDKWIWALSITLILFLLLPSSSGAWLSSHHDFQNTNSTDERGPEPPLGIIWKVDRGIWDTTGLLNVPPLVHGNYVYDGPYILSAYNKSNGKRLWNAPTGKPTDMIYYRNIVYVISGESAHTPNVGVWAVNATTGKIIWQFKDENRTISNNGFIWNNELVVAVGKEWGYSNNDTLRPTKLNISIAFFNLNNGKMEMKKIDTIDWRSPYLRVAYEYGNIYIRAPNYVYCVNLTTFKLLWKANIKNFSGGYTRAIVIVGHGKVFVPHFVKIHKDDWENEIVAINAFTGKILWKKQTDYGGEFGTMFSYSPEYDEIFTLIRVKGTKYEYNLTALNGTTGNVVWATRDPKWDFATVSIVPTSKYVYMDSRESIVDIKNDTFVSTREVERVYNITDGKLAGIFTVFKTDMAWAYYRYPQISVSDGVIYIADNSYLIAIGHVDAMDPSNLYIGAGVSAGIVLTAIITWVFFVKRRNHTK